MKRTVIYICIVFSSLNFLNAQQDHIPIDSIYILRELSRKMYQYTPEERMAEESDIMNWLSNGKSSKDGPSGDFIRVDQMLTQEEGAKA